MTEYAALLHNAFAKRRYRPQLAALLRARLSKAAVITEEMYRELTERFFALLAIEMMKLRLKATKGDSVGHEFHGNQWTGGAGAAEKPTSAHEGGVKNNVHALLSSGHSFTFEELQHAAGDVPKQQVLKVLAELKNPKWAGPKGTLAIEKQGSHYYVKMSEPGKPDVAPQFKDATPKPTAATEKPTAGPKPVPTVPKEAAQPKPTTDVAKAPAEKMNVAEANKVYDKAMNSAAIKLAFASTKGDKTANLIAVLDYKVDKATAMAQWAANTSGKDAEIKPQGFFKADDALAGSLTSGSSTTDAIKQWKSDTVAEKAGKFGVTPAETAKPTSSAPPVTGNEKAEPQLYANKTAADLVPSNFKSLGQGDFVQKGGMASVVENQMDKLRSALDENTHSSVESKKGVEQILNEHLKDSKNFQVLQKYFEGYAATGNSQYKSLSAALVSNWAGTSADHDNLAQAMQVSIHDAFGMDAKDVAHGNMQYVFSDKDHTGLFQKAAEHIAGQGGKQPSVDVVRAGLRDFALAQYAATQKWFSERGIKDVYVARGMHTNNHFDKPELVDLKLQPASSFSADYTTAHNFKDTGEVYFAKVPASQILGTYRTGYGCRNEHEVVVLAHPKTRAVGSSSAVSSRNLAVGHVANHGVWKKK